jgi:site-specific DNA-methyltransferase (cytosine-N4-specific)
MIPERYTTKQVAEMAGVHRDTLLRWLRDGRIAEPERNRNGWRVFTKDQAQTIADYANGNTQARGQIKENQTSYKPYASAVERLKETDWDFKDLNTGYLTHGIHPYPAKFIPQIPKTLIRELASAGDTVLDPFCGSGTALIESLRLECNAVGIDANPLACLISRAKSARISNDEADTLFELANEIERFGRQTYPRETFPLFPDIPPFPVPTERPVFKGIDDWFDPHVIDELAVIKNKCMLLEQNHLREIALTAFSSIIVTVSRQDSDTRYVRRKKNLKPGDTFLHFSRALSQAVRRLLELSEEISSDLSVRVYEANILNPPEIEPVDLVVCSPPYPNAYSYHLYHRTRMLWLEMDQPKFKAEEIGSHRKYSRKGSNAATADTFRGELYTVLSWLSQILRPDRHACFVIGDSTLKGQTIQNDKLLTEVASDVGYHLEANISRTLQSTKKYFNPAVGKIKDEHIVILRNTVSERIL